MRNQLRLLLLISRGNISRHSSQSSLQVHSSFLSRSLSTSPAKIPLFQNPGFPNLRFFSSSEAAIEHKDSDQVAIVTDVFAKSLKNDEFKQELESNNVVVNHDLVLSVLQSGNVNVGVARRFFDWVSEVGNEKLSSKCYNFMLGVLGENGLVKEFWVLVEVMKSKGYGVNRGTVVRVSKKFEKDGLRGELGKLEELFASGSVGNSVEKICSRVSKVFETNVWGDDVEKELMSVSYSSDLVGMVLEKLGSDPNRGLVFFRWVEESDLFKHDEWTYNVMARVLGREGYTDKFWRVLDEMSGAGYQMTSETYIHVFNQFMKKKLIQDAVILYEFAMGGVNKPSVQDCVFLLRKIVVGENPDMELFKRVVKKYKESGNALTSSNVKTVFKSLTSFKDCNKILKAVEEGGLSLSDDLQSKIAFRLSSEGQKYEALEFIDSIEASGSGINNRTWLSVVEGYYVAGHLDKASVCIKKMIEKEGPSSVGYPFGLLVTAYCSKNRAKDAYKRLSALVNKKQLKPQHTTYKALTKKLLVQGYFKEAVNLLGLMKTHGFPPFLDPFVEYISKTGTVDDALLLLKLMTVKRFPATAVYLRLFEAYFKAGKHDEAHNFLSKCPRFIRNNADVLNLFYSKRASKEAVAECAATA
ncbi:Pentatricopeptide repeat-containing protein, mitochondrial [Heracleum sosnowskyi]|uniref:Pentatricopeptide repeat-containing protein, mitochondrial n=1 Tax=Heracleum sosnowskyi TaxID=360622 RepID=A0AAD8I077_9APIA|nr:Pentatricopeptide repeat-containing protein, mitochondrial [Heracleum sosnowskyi]